MQVNAQRSELFHQRSQQLAVVQLTFTGQIDGLVEAALQRGLAFLQRSARFFFHGGQAGVDAAVFLQQAEKACGVALILAVPENQRAVLLQKHRLVQLANQLRPAVQRVLAHAHHAGLGNGRLGQRRQHGSGHACGSAIALRAMGVIEINGVTALGQRQGQEATHEAAAQNGDL